MHLTELAKLYKSVIGGDYAQQKEIGFSPRAGVRPITVTVPFRWLHADRNVEFSLHAWRILNPIFQEFIATKDPVYVVEACNLISDWNRYRKDGGKSPFLWYDMAVGLRAVALAFIANLEKNGYVTLDIAASAMLHELSTLHIEHLSKAENITAGNHAIYQILGLRLLSIARDVPDTEDFCNDELEKLLQKSFDRNSVNTENSPFYHHYNIGLLWQLRGNLFPKLDDRITHILKQGNSISGWLTAPDGNFFCIGDTEGKGKPLTAPGPADKRSLPGKFVHKDLHESGYIVVRSHPSTPLNDSAAVVFHATNASLVHAHADHLSFILIHKGAELLSDPGKYTYNYDKWRQYFISDRAHNVVGLSTHTFYPDDTPPGSARLDPLVRDGDAYVLSGTVQRGQIFKTNRRIKYTPAQCVSIIDQVSHFTEHPVESRFHLGAGLDCKLRGHEYVVSRDNVPLAVIKPDMQQLDMRDFKGSVDPIIGWISKKYGQKQASISLVLTYPPQVRSIAIKIELL